MRGRTSCAFWITKSPLADRRLANSRDAITWQAFTRQN
jgi:hypothetical protein